ncbi:unnamed protein product [Fraxinus pennsylvanica]|uniref:Protein CHUP1, chloroplastic n=1 Tax=Fraxinus pennsylvanica TaxID=56036 RepID=A0AAD2AEB2_9LAMI|nr:unnamed protein product [Fraxinus pennsylvanica]
MVAGKVKEVMGFQKSSVNQKQKPEISHNPPPSSMLNSGKQKQQNQKGNGAVFSRSSGGYVPRASAKVQPRPPDISELLRLVEELRDRESRFKTELLEQKLLRESFAIVPVFENENSNKDSEIERYRKKIECLEAENERLREDVEVLHNELYRQKQKYEEKIKAMQAELSDIKKTVVETQQEHEEVSSSTQNLVDVSSNYKPSTTNKNLRKFATHNYVVPSFESIISFKKEDIVGSVEINERPKEFWCNSEENAENPHGIMGFRSRVPRIPKPPPRPSASLLSSISSSSSSSSVVSSASNGSLSDSDDHALVEISNVHPPPPPSVKVVTPPPPPPPSQSKVAPPPPPPPPKGSKTVPAKVRRIPEVVEFYHSLMRRDSNPRRDTTAVGGGVADAPAAGATAKDMIGEIENRSAHLLAIKTDVESQGDFIRFLIKEVEGAAFTDIEDVVPFVKWLDDELSYLVDERAVLKHFNWPERKADALREAAFEYSDLKKLEFEASSFRDDPRQPCGQAFKKMQALFEKLEHGVYNLCRIRESAAKGYKVLQIPIDWMLDTGYVSQIKLASVKLAMKYMKRVSAELEFVGGFPEEEELIIQGVKFAFRVHQFAGGFDMETMRAFQELRDKARL